MECPNYAGNRLDAKTRYRAAKWLSEFAPSYDQHKKLSAADKMFLDVVDHLKQLIGNDKLLTVQHILPHFPRAGEYLHFRYKYIFKYIYNSIQLHLQ